MDSGGHACWRRGILTLGEIYQVLLVQTLFSEKGIFAETALNEDHFFHHIVANPDKGKIYNRTYRNIRSWDFLKNESRIALVPGFAAIGYCESGYWGFTNLDLEGSDQSALIYLKALHGKFQDVRLTFHKSMGLEQFDGLPYLKSDTEFYGKPMLGKQATSFIEQNAQEDWKVGVAIPGYISPFQYFPMKVFEKNFEEVD